MRSARLSDKARRDIAGQLSQLRESLKAVPTEFDARNLLSEMASVLASLGEAPEVALDIKVIYRPLGGHRGLSAVRRGRGVVVVESALIGQDRAFVVAHEVAHVLLWSARRADSSIDDETEESLCDYFASLVTRSSRSSLSA
jgi:Zn-dependent peptidase ImmA (M78 family)